MRFSRVIAILAVVLVSGCADLAAIRDFSKISADSAGFTNIVDDYERSADKRLMYMYPKAEQAGEIPRLQSEKIDRATRAKELRNVLKAIENYMSALGDLAADKAVDANDNIKALVTQLDSAKLIDSKLAKPASAIASLVSKMILDGYRQHQLRQAVNEANPYIQDIDKNFSLLLVNDEKGTPGGFPLALRAERAFVSDYYDYWHIVALENKERATVELIRVKKTR